jgi:hypothetical protein
MPRPKGFKLTDAQKAKMEEGRKKAKVKVEASMSEAEKVKKEVKKEVEIIGYGIDKGDDRAYPIFGSEKSTYRGKIFVSPKEAVAYNQKAIDLKKDT